MAEKIKSVLLIDDDPLIQRLFGGRLSKLGFNTLYAHNGIEGREMARRMRPDLILMDMHMPGDEDGMKTAIRLREEGEFTQTPISMLTAEDLSLDVERMLKQTYRIEYMHKGIEENVFADKVQKLLGIGPS